MEMLYRCAIIRDTVHIPDTPCWGQRSPCPLRAFSSRRQLATGQAVLVVLLRPQ